MKIQYMGVIFIIILFPMILVLSAYMQLQIDNIAVDLQYDTKLFEATLDGIQAFELNTVNNRFSQIADSQKRDVEAGINTFISSLSSHLGLGGVNNDYLLPYIPAVLFTMYDGYYIYAPTYAEELKEVEKTLDENGRPITDSYGNPTSIIDLESKNEPMVRNHLLKPYIYYTTRYISGINDFIVNYTLDNYIIIYGKINGKYVTKSGFLNKMKTITISLDKPELEAILAKKILNYILPPGDTYQNSKEEIIRKWNEQLNSLEERETLMDKLSKIDQVALISDMGENLFKEMCSKGNLSNFSDNKILNYLFDSTINEKFEINRNVIQDIVSNSNNPDQVGNMLYKEIKLKGNTLSNLTDDEIFNEIADKTDVYYKEGVHAIDYIKDNNKFIDEITDVFTVKYKGSEINIDNSSMLGIEINDSDAKRYYLKSLKFTNWVNDNLNEIKAKDAVDDSGKTIIEFSGNNTKIFNTSNDNDPTKLDSAFSQHRIEAIKLSIQTNLNTAIAQYNRDFYVEKTYELKLPNLKANEWSEITRNVSMVTFLQGIQIGNKIYNDYVVVSSNKNKETINENDIYYINLNVNKNGSGVLYYHKDDCSDLTKNGTDEIIGLKNIEYDLYKDEEKSGNISYDSSSNLDRVMAEVKNYEVKGCYNCIVNRNYDKVSLNVKNDNEYNKVKNRLKAIYTAIAKEKNNLYKINDYYNVDILTTDNAQPSTE